MRKLAFIFCTTALAATLLSGCRAKNLLPDAGGIDPILAPVPATEPVTPPAPMPPSPFEISTKSTQKDDEPIEFSIEIKNTTAKTIDLNFTSGQKFDFIATREGETDPTWSYGMNKRFIQSLSTTSLEPGKSVRFETVWKDAKPGKYTIRALVKANGGINTAPFEITVK